MREGLLKYEKYRGLVLTTAGENLARKIAHRHRLLTDFLKLLGLSDRVIYHDVEGMEHHISLPTLRAIEALTKQLRRRPRSARSCKPRSFSNQPGRRAAPTISATSVWRLHHRSIS